jgi:hypothetical protein
MTPFGAGENRIAAARVVPQGTRGNLFTPKNVRTFAYPIAKWIDSRVRMDHRGVGTRLC